MRTYIATTRTDDPIVRVLAPDLETAMERITEELSKNPSRTPFLRQWEADGHWVRTELDDHYMDSTGKEWDLRGNYLATIPDAREPDVMRVQVLVPVPNGHGYDRVTLLVKDWPTPEALQGMGYQESTDERGYTRWETQNPGYDAGEIGSWR